MEADFGTSGEDTRGTYACAGVRERGDDGTVFAALTSEEVAVSGTEGLVDIRSPTTSPVGLVAPDVGKSSAASEMPPSRDPEE